MNKLKDILKFAMRMEQDAGDFYSFYLDKAKSANTRKLFGELVEIEKQHYEILKSKFDALGFEEPPLVISWVVDSSNAAKDPHILADNSDITYSGENESSDLNIIRMAYLIENDFALFYKNAADSVENAEAKAFLKELSKWEEEHKALFYEKYQQMLKTYWNEVSAIITPA